MKKLLSLPLALIAMVSISAQSTEILQPESVNVTFITQQAQSLVQQEMQTLNIDNNATKALLSLTKELDKKAKVANPQRYKKSDYAANLAD